LTGRLQAQGDLMNRKRVERLMRSMGLEADAPVLDSRAQFTVLFFGTLDTFEQRAGSAQQVFRHASAN